MKTLTEIGISVAVMGFVCSVMHIDLALLLVALAQSLNNNSIPLLQFTPARTHA